ncbi:MAG TPA: hypothetical protein VM008_17585 [Phycisphaerae bacterium]|nr:hypothetical protein [Phycisphaerae bacterium]
MSNSSAIGELLRIRIAETEAWCQVRVPVSADARTSLRSEELRPDGKFFPDSGTHLTGIEFANWYREQEKKNEMLVESVANRRSALLLSTSQCGGDRVPKSAGKLLIYTPFYSTGDTLASGDSEGFFDDDDSPPWDTFLFYFSRPNPQTNSLTAGFSAAGLEGVLCWVPQRYWYLAEAGIRCNPCGCLKWFDREHGSGIID